MIGSPIFGNPLGHFCQDLKGSTPREAASATDFSRVRGQLRIGEDGFACVCVCVYIYIYNYIYIYIYIYISLCVCVVQTWFYHMLLASAAWSCTMY